MDWRYVCPFVDRLGLFEVLDANLQVLNAVNHSWAFGSSFQLACL